MVEVKINIIINLTYRGPEVHQDPYRWGRGVVTSFNLHSGGEEVEVKMLLLIEIRFRN